MTAPAGSALLKLETCAAETCDLCRHLTDGKPSIEILTPSNGAVLAPGLIEVTVRVYHFTVTTIGSCGASDTSCGHIHINLDGSNCLATQFFNNVVYATQPDGSADTTTSTTPCKVSVAGRTVKLT